MLSIRDILSIIFKRKMIILCFFATLCISAFLFLKFVPATYTASSRILIKLGREDIYTPSVTSDVMVSPLMDIARQQQLNSEVEILKSDNLAIKLVEERGAEGVYPGMLTVHPWYTPKGVLQRLVNVYNAFQGFFIPLTKDLSPEQRATKRFLRKDLEVAGTGESNVIEVKVSSKHPQLAADINNDLVSLYLKERSQIHNDPEGRVFQSQLDSLEERLATAQNELDTYRKDNDVVDVAAERKTLLEREAEIRTTIVSLQGRASERQRLNKWYAELDKVEGKLATLSEDELEYSRLVQNVEVLEKSRKLYLEKLEELKINQAMADAEVGNAVVISKAVAPTSPSSPKFWMVLVALFVVGIFGGIGLAIVIDLLDDTIETDSDVQIYLRLPVLAKISAAP